MTRATRSYLDRFPLISTHHLASAREATAKFWPKHTSDVLGPEDYALQMNRVLLGSLAVSYVVCTSRIRVIPSEPSDDSALYMPFEGSVDIVPDGLDLTGSSSRLLLQGPYRRTRFEASPIRCLVVDLPAATLAAAAAAAKLPPPVHASIGGREGEQIARLVKRLATAANRSQAVVALQRFSARDRLARMPDSIQRQEREVIHAIVQAASSGGPLSKRSGADACCDVSALKAWLASQAHRPVRIAEIAKRAGVSPRTVERAFLRTGCTPLEYLRGVRLERARRMLVEPGPSPDGGRGRHRGRHRTPGPVCDGVSPPLRRTPLANPHARPQSLGHASALAAGHLQGQARTQAPQRTRIRWRWPSPVIPSSARSRTAGSSAGESPRG